MHPVVKPVLERLVDRPKNMTAAGRQPTRAIKAARFHEMSPHERKEWMDEARMDAILGSCRLSLSSVRSGVRCYIAFVLAMEPQCEHALHIMYMLCQLPVRSY